MNNEGIIQGSSNVIHADTRSPFVKFDLVVQAQQIMRCDSDSGKKLIKSMVLRTADRQGMC